MSVGFFSQGKTQLSAKSILPMLLMAIAAVNRPIRAGLKWQLGDFCTAVRAGPVALKHLALESALRSLAKIFLEGHVPYLTKFPTQLWAFWLATSVE